MIRHVGVYNAQDWRCYKPTDEGAIHNNIAGQTLEFWKFEASAAPDPEPDPDQILLSKLSEAPAHDSYVAILCPKENMVLTPNASGSKLAGVDATFTEDKLNKTGDIAYLRVQVADGVFTLDLEGAFLTSAATGNGLSFSEELTDCGKWTLEQQEDGTWIIMNVGANYNGNYNQALEYYRGFTTYGLNTAEDKIGAYKFDFYSLMEEEPEYSTIAEALAGAENAEFTVKGVVTLVDGKNVYIQDETGGICLYFSAAPTDLNLGDTVIGTGSRAFPFERIGPRPNRAERRDLRDQRRSHADREGDHHRRADHRRHLHLREAQRPDRHRGL